MQEDIRLYFVEYRKLAWCQPNTTMGVSRVTEKSKQEEKISKPKDPSSPAEMLKAKWPWIETGVWTDSMLTALVNGVKGGKWFSLIDKVYNKKTLWSAWERVQANKGAPGVDEMTIQKFEAGAGKYLNELSIALEQGDYLPEAVKRVLIPKGDGKIRPLGIPIIKDRIVQGALKKVLEPIYENEFLDMSYGFRPGRGQKDALRDVDTAIKEGLTWVVDADMKAFFDSIPHDRLMNKIAAKISDGRVLALIRAFLKARIMDEFDEWEPEEGTPQGGVLSPLLANIYLHDLDQLMTSKGFRMVRYADDFVILTDSQEYAEIALELVRSWVQKNGLSLHPDKTHVGNCLIEGQGFEFLGYRFEAGERKVRKKSLDKFKDSVRKQTSRVCGKSIEMVVTKLRPMLRGWFNYFKHAHKWTFERMDGFVRRRLRTILRYHEKRRGRGINLVDHMRWSNTFFANLELFSMRDAWNKEMVRRS